MADKDYSLEGLNNFLEYAAKKGLIKENTAASRRRAANSILGILEPHEVVDLKQVDIDHVFDRFQNLQGTGFKPESLRVYKSRLKSALEDFFAYTENPAAFKPSGIQRSSPKVKKEPAKQKPKPSASGAGGKQQPIGSAEHEKPPISDRHISIPVPLREGITVTINNVPADLTGQEAERLAAIVKAYAVPSG